MMVQYNNEQHTQLSNSKEGEGLAPNRHVPPPLLAREFGLPLLRKRRQPF
jgi:hypothetical protein